MLKLSFVKASTFAFENFANYGVDYQNIQPQNLTIKLISSKFSHISLANISTFALQPPVQIFAENPNTKNPLALKIIHNNTFPPDA